MPVLTDATLRVGATLVDRVYLGSTLVYPAGTPSATPTFASMTPKTGAASGGTPVTITGTDLTSVTGITIGGVTATSFTVVNATTITCTTPAGTTGASNLRMLTASGHVFVTGAFHFGTPVISLDSLSVTTGDNAGGTTVVLTGTNFIGETPSVTTCYFGGQSADITSLSETSITCTTPMGAAGVVDVYVANSDGTGGLPNAFTYTSNPLAAPVFGSINPTSGPTVGGELVTIAGTNLQSVTGVTFDGVPATSVTVLSSIALTCVAPAHAAAAATVVVTTAGGTSSIAGAYTYSAYTPVTSGTELTLANTGPTAWHDATLGRTLTTGDLVVQSGVHDITDFVGEPWYTPGTGRVPTLIYGVHFTGTARVNINRVIFRACLFDEPVSTAAGGTQQQDIVFDFSRVSPPGAGGAYCFGDEAYSAHRSSGRGSSDGIRINGGRSVQHIDESIFTIKMAAEDDHDDGAQIFGGSGRIHIRRGVLDVDPEGGKIPGASGGPNACVQSADFGVWSVLDLEVADCLLDGWETPATLRLYDGALTEHIRYVVRGNRFASRDSAPLHRGAVKITPLDQIDWSGNVYDDDAEGISLA